MFNPRSIEFELIPREGPLGPFLHRNALDKLSGEVIKADGEMFEVAIPLTPEESGLIVDVITRASERWRSHIVAQLRDPDRAEAR